MFRDTPPFIAALLESGWFWFLTRLVITFMFWVTGIGWLLNFEGARQAAGMAGLQPVNAWGAVLIAFYLLGSLAILLDRFVWLAAGAFGVFTALTILLVHNWWTMPPEQAFPNWLTAKEHITVIGGLMTLAVASHLRRLWLAGRSAA